MNKNVRAMLVVAGLSACGGGNGGNTVSAEPSPKERLSQINKAYVENGIQAKRTWGGKRVVIGGAFDSSGRNPDKSASILISPGDVPQTIGELNVGSGRDDFIAKLKKGDDVTMECTVDPARESFMAGYIDCAPSGPSS